MCMCFRLTKTKENKNVEKSGKKKKERNKKHKIQWNQNPRGTEISKCLNLANAAIIVPNMCVLCVQKRKKKKGLFTLFFYFVNLTTTLSL